MCWSHVLTQLIQIWAFIEGATGNIRSRCLLPTKNIVEPPLLKLVYSVYSSPETFVPIMDTKHAAPATMKLSGLVSSVSKVTGAKGGPFSYKKNIHNPPPQKKTTVYIHLSFLDSAGSFFFAWFPQFCWLYISLNTGSNFSLATSGGLRWSPFLVGEWPWNPMNLI